MQQQSEKTKEIICGVCLDTIRLREQKIKMLECGHPMHIACFDQMMIYHHHSCPLCRQGFLSEFSRFQLYLYHHCTMLWLFYIMRLCLILLLTSPLLVLLFTIHNSNYRIVIGITTFVFWFSYWSLIFYIDYQSVRTSI